MKITLKFQDNSILSFKCKKSPFLPLRKRFYLEDNLMLIYSCIDVNSCKFATVNHLFFFRLSSSIRLAIGSLICHGQSTMLCWNDSRK